MKDEPASDQSGSRLATLSRRERQVLEGLVAGLSNKAIAREYSISPRTVEVYRTNLMSKTQAANLSELLRFAMGAGVAKPAKGGSRAIEAQDISADLDAESERPRLSIVILPFATFSNDPEQEFFADALVEDLTTDMSRIAGSFVIARNTAFTYKGRAVNAKQVGRELGVLHLLEGSIRKLDNLIRVNVQLIDARSGGHIWADQFDGSAVGLLSLHEQVTAILARTLSLNMIEAAARRTALQENPDAADLVLRARAYALRPRTKDNALKSRSSFERAIRLAPDSHDAMIGLAEILSAMAMSLLSDDPAADLARADELVSRVLTEAPTSAWAHYVKGETLRGLRATEEAAFEYQTAIALDRNYTPAIANLAFAKLLLGEPAKTIPLTEQAIRRSPHDPLLAIWQSRIGLAEMFLERYDRALNALKLARGLNPGLAWSHFYLAAAYALTGELDGAKASLAQAQRLSPKLQSVAGYVALSHMSHPGAQAMREATLIRGLRLAGLPETA